MGDVVAQLVGLAAQARCPGAAARDEPRRLDARQIARNSNVLASGELVVELATPIQIGRVAAVELESAAAALSRRPGDTRGA
jgi:hypothetical protein